VDAYVDALASIYLNGRIEYAIFEATNRDDFFSAERFDLQGLRNPIEAMLRQPSVCFPFSRGMRNPDNLIHLEVLHQGGCQFEGAMADTLLAGGAYQRWKRPVEEAKGLAAACCLGLREAAPDSPWSPFLVRGNWGSFFEDVAWDVTFIVQFHNDARWFVLCATDTD
jgi:hypothetical protein